MSEGMSVEQKQLMAENSFSVLVEEAADGSVGSAVDILAHVSKLSKGKIKDAMQKGAVWREERLARSTKSVSAPSNDEPAADNAGLYGHGRRGKPRRLRRATAALNSGDKLLMYYNARVLAASCPEAKLIADQGAYSVWDKPAGMLCQGSKWGDHLTLNRWVETRLEPRRPVFVVHRLDRMASGLVVLAHTKQAAAALSAQFAQRQVSKKYECIVHGVFQEDIPVLLEEPLYGKWALTRIESINSGSDGNLTLDIIGNGAELAPLPKNQFTKLLVSIETGRKHQIRRHLADYGFPIAGDRQYAADAASPKTPDGALLDLQLRAIQLAFSDPKKGGRVEWKI
ncbi:RNA pseudouridine synthase [bacterium]|jgi:tRNA pseudouridine32 synthase/23S rRNA pseudouridine746 synthase|nr:RNA pseudouridine synthase [bacterium]